MLITACSGTEIQNILRVFMLCRNVEKMSVHILNKQYIVNRMKIKIGGFIGMLGARIPIILSENA
jgi:hypothetical protein